MRGAVNQKPCQLKGRRVFDVCVLLYARMGKGRGGGNSSEPQGRQIQIWACDGFSVSLATSKSNILTVRRQISHQKVTKILTRGEMDVTLGCGMY